MPKSSILINLDDPRSTQIAEAMSNKTSRKILALLAEKEMTGSGLAKELNAPLNTITYNLKKLTDSELIEKTKKIFWSAKGKRIEIYKISNKKIIISPKTLVRGVAPAVLFIGLAAFGIKIFTSMKYSAQIAKDVIEQPANLAVREAQEAGSQATAAASQKLGEALQTTVASTPDYWLWFLLGGLTALLILLLWNWFRKD